jgi:uncharacterized membrane protein YphA (DoxX/SURF4 family)
METPTSTTATASAPKGFARHLPTIARVLLGLMFFVFGLMGLLNLMPPPPPETLPPKLVAFSTAMMNTGFLFQLVKGTEVIVGALLLLNRFVPLALTLIAPVIVNIVAVHVFLAPSGLGMAIVILALEIYLAWAYRAAFRPMLAARVTPS